jgi:hypothetical protein
MNKPVRVELDPLIQVSQADLEAQLSAALEMREIVSRLNMAVAKVDDLTRQLTTLSENTRRGPQGPPAAADGVQAGGGDDLRAALDELKKLRLSLVREAQFVYRYPPRLRDEANSLLSGIINTVGAPTEPQKLRMRELTEETEKTIGELNQFIATTIKRINDRLSAMPHVVTGAAVR